MSAIKRLKSFVFKFFKAIIGFFSIYEGSFEKKVDKFFKKLSPASSPIKTKEKLLELMQEDIVRLNLFLERKFKGYKKTRKSYRKKLYENVERLKEDFLKYYLDNHNHFKQFIKTKGVSVDERFIYLSGIMHYLKPGKHFEYREGSAFEKLLRDPKKTTLIGDCNQIVTLYIYLYSLKYPITDLKIKLMPGHVCLHFKGMDVEATSGRFHHYKKYAYLSGVEEIIPTNLLDISDKEEGKYDVSPENILKASEVAYILSSHRETVEQNLKVAYHNLTMSLLKQKRFSKADEIAKKSGDESLKKAVLQSKLHHLSLQIKKCKTVANFREKKAVIRQMLEIATKLQNRKVIEFCNSILSKIAS